MNLSPGGRAGIQDHAGTGVIGIRTVRKSGTGRWAHGSPRGREDRAKGSLSRPGTQGIDARPECGAFVADGALLKYTPHQKQMQKATGADLHVTASAAAFTVVALADGMHGHEHQLLGLLP